MYTQKKYVYLPFLKSKLQLALVWIDHTTGPKIKTFTHWFLCKKLSEAVSTDA